MSSVSADFKTGYDAYQQGDYKTAIKEYTSLAKQGNVYAQYNLGLMYDLGKGVAKDEVQAVAWYQKAAEQDYASAQFNLGLIYNLGKGVAKDDQTAVKWYQKAAEQGIADAQYSLGLMYANGRGVAKDEVQAAVWYRKAAEQGQADAQNNLGVMYAKGEGVPVDDVLAYMWANIAMNGELRDILAEGMLPEQIAEAQRLSREWRAKKVNNSKNKISIQNQPLIDINLHATGTGFRINRNGAIVTNNHVIKNCTSIKANGKTVRLLSADSKNDLALLQGSVSVNIAKFSSGKGVRIGDEVVVAGYPLRGVLGGGLNISTGTVSALAGLGNDSGKLQISAPINGGNSGGPLLDKSGRVVGVIVSKVSAVKSVEILGDIIQGANFAIKANVVQSFLDMNSVDYQMSSNNKVQSTADIAEQAKIYTVLVECWK